MAQRPLRRVVFHANHKRPQYYGFNRYRAQVYELAAGGHDPWRTVRPSAHADPRRGNTRGLYADEQDRAGQPQGHRRLCRRTACRTAQESKRAGARSRDPRPRQPAAGRDSRGPAALCRSGCRLLRVFHAQALPGSTAPAYRCADRPHYAAGRVRADQPQTGRADPAGNDMVRCDHVPDRAPDVLAERLRGCRVCLPVRGQAVPLGERYAGTVRGLAERQQLGDRARRGEAARPQRKEAGRPAREVRRCRCVLPNV